ncbi:glycosyltransferase [Rhodococcus hoagii]|nr:glycosyltransferase [Prescottella equi]
MLPPAPALLAVLAAKPRKTKLVADLHTGFFSDKKWRWAAKPSLMLLKRSSVIVTNDELARYCSNLGVSAFVLHDPIDDRTSPYAGAGEYILCPLSYANDEPVETILAAASKLSTLEFRLTGNAPARVRERAPKNVKFTGFVSTEQYERLVQNSAVVVALTTRDLTMQRAGYEALMAGIPQVTADFPVLRAFLSDAARYADPTDGAALSNAIAEILDDHRYYCERVRSVLTKRVSEQETELLKLRKFLQGQALKPNFQAPSRSRIETMEN